MKHLYIFLALCMCMVGIGACSNEVTPEVTYNEYYDLNIGEGNIADIDLSQDGSKIVIRGSKSGAVSFSSFVAVYESLTGVKLYEFTSSNDSSYKSAVFSTDGTKLAVSNKFGDAFVVNSQTGVVLQKFSNAFYPKVLENGSAIVAIRIEGNENTPVTLSMYAMNDGRRVKDFSFNELGSTIGDWELEGVLHSEQFVIRLELNKGTRSESIVYWDIETDKKRSDIIIENVNNIDGKGFTKDLSTIILKDFTATASLNAYNTITGTKINTFPLTYTGVSQKREIFNYTLANDLIFAVQGNGQNNALPPSIYKVTEGKEIKPLSSATQNAHYQRLTFSYDSKFLAGIEKKYEGIVIEPSPMKVRIWYVK